MRKDLLVIFFLISVIRGISQSNGSLFNEIPKITPPSPNAAALEKFGIIPVDYSTGIPNISYPTWSWSRGKLHFQLGLAYHAGGHKVEDLPSNVGLGWTLGGLGRITRTIKGLPDDHLTQGWLYTSVFPLMTTYGYDGAYHYSTHLTQGQQSFPASTAINSYNSSYTSTVRAVNESFLDGEQDIYSYSLPGFSGKFIFDKNKNVILLEHSNVKIEAVYSSYNQGIPNGAIISFSITDDQGVIYKFEHVENQKSETITDSQGIGGPSQQTVASSWLLTKIVDPTTNDQITFTYKSHSTVVNPIKYETGFSQSQTWDLEISDDQNRKALPSFHKSNELNSYVLITSENATPEIIQFPDGSTVNFEYNLSRADLINDKALTSIIIRNLKNDIIKQFELHYSYFTYGAEPLIFYESGNDYSKRLKLDKIDEISADGKLRKPTVFNYNSIQLNPRNTMNIDYWGYNVNPMRNNIVRIPKARLQVEELNLLENGYNLYAPGADRSPDPQFVKASILEKITYPTGGFTSFEYECNRAFSPVEYYENKMVTNTPQWVQNSFNLEYDLHFAERTESPVELLLKTIEPNPRPAPQSGDPQSCFEESQDFQIAKFQIYSTDGTFSIIIEETYGEFLVGVRRIIELPLNKSYKIKFLYNSGALCAFQYPFHAVASGTYYTQILDKLSGGLRVKTIVSNDGAGKTLTKKFIYNNPDGRSSATLDVIPNFGYYRSTWDATLLSDQLFNYSSWFIHKIHRTSSPTYTLNYYNGSPLIYSRVIEKESDGSEIERQYDHMTSLPGGQLYPFTPGQDFPNLSGLLLKEIVRDNTGNVRSEKTNTYTKHEINLTDEYNRNVKTGIIATAREYPAKYYVVDIYRFHTTRAELTTSMTSTYENNMIQSTTTTYGYDQLRYYLRSEKTANSKSEQILTQYSYPFDKSGSPYNEMVQKNILKPVVSTLKAKSGILNEALFSRQTNYYLWNGSLPLPQVIQTSLLNNQPETDVIFNAYDTKGNIRQFTTKDGIINSFIWGYKDQYPVAKIVGKSYDDAVIQSGIDLNIIDNPLNDDMMRLELSKLRTIPDCFTTTYTYKPLVGLTSETDANGKTIYYEYDSYSRLTIVRDNNNYIIKKLCYKYDGQPVQCNNEILWENKSLQGTFEKTGCTSTRVTYTIPQGKYTSTVSQSDADNQALSDLNQNGQTYADSQPCVQSVCNVSTCSAPDKKCINGICETGQKVCTSITGGRNSWTTVYHYRWSDGSVSPDYTESGIGCLEL